MKRVSIRNMDSPGVRKPRVFDALIDNNNVLLEIKGAKSREIISLASVLSQISKAMGKTEYHTKHKSTEP